jgi:DNA-binding MarR family transcriptional regulator
VRRQPDPTDGRFTKAILTAEGRRTLVQAAPRHVADVRATVLDAVTAE